MRKKYFLVITLLTFGLVFSQEQTTFLGIVIDAKTQNPLTNIVVSIHNSSVTQLTNTDGKFKLQSSIKGEQLLLLHSQGYKDLLLKIQSGFGQEINLGILQLEDNFSDETPADSNYAFVRI